MKINVIPAAQLSADHFSAWSRLQRSDATLASPFFRPEFTQAVAASRDGVEVAIWEQDGEPMGFLPYERSYGGVGWPIGSRINQFQGAIARSDVPWSPREIVRATGLRGFQFDHLLAAQQTFGPYQCVASNSPYLGLSAGFEHYRRSRGKSAASFISHILQKDRKAGRELGEVRVESNPQGYAELSRLIQWKIEQSHRTRVPCAFDLKWVRQLHDRLLATTTDDFSGMLFNLYMADRLVAGFFCLRSGSVLQGSILGFDREYGRYAPGLVLLTRVAQMANALGVTRMDLGSGSEEYKAKLASDFDRVTEGIVPSHRLFGPLCHGWINAKHRLRATRLRGPVRAMRAWMLTARIRLGYAD